MAITEGCAPIYIHRIRTSQNTYIASRNKRLKLSEKLFLEIQENIKNDNGFEMEMHIGEEVLNAYFDQRNFSISASRSELESEIIQEVNEQFKKKYPKICPQFSRCVFKG